MKQRSQEKAEALITWRSAVTTSVLAGLFATLAPSFGLVNFAGTSGAFVVSRAIVVALSAVFLAVLFRQRGRPRLRVARWAFVLPTIPVLVMYWYLDRDRAAQGLPVELFARPLAASMAFAILTPPRPTISLVAIAIFTFENLVMFWAHRHNGPIQGWQPWSNLFAALGLVLLTLYRAHRQRQEVAILVEAEEARGLQRLVAAYRAVRDLVNTPLQTLWVSASLLSARYPDAAEVTAKMERSVQRLNELNDALSDDAPVVEWPPGAEAFDPLSVLRASRVKRGG